VPVASLRQRVANTAGYPASVTKLVSDGHVLTDGDEFITDGALVLALCMPAVTPPLAPTSSSPAAAAHSTTPGAEDDALENWRLDSMCLGPRSKRLATRVVALGVPEVVVVLLCSPRAWTRALLFAAWCLLSRALSRREMGPPFVLVSILTVMVMNLGTRGPGQLSAYSLFNPGVQALPGATSTDELDTQIRAGLR
jgi:hypothetical protein